MKIITMCGSMRFINEMLELSIKLELEGNCVLIPVYRLSNINEDVFTKEEKLVLNKMHQERIKLADAIYVVNVEGYIGNTTKKEIEYARFLNKEILSLEPFTLDPL